MGFFNRARIQGSWLSLAIGRDGIAAASVARGAARPVVQRAQFFPGAPDTQALDRAGKELRANGYRITTLLGPGEYQMLTIDAPNVPADELKTAVRWRLKDMLDFPVNDATIDVLDIPADGNAAVRPQRTLFVVAARNAMVAARQKLFGDAKVGLSVIDIPEMAQRNIAALLEPEGRGLAMLTLGEDGGLLTVTCGGELYLSRRIDMALASLTDADHERRNQAFDRITLELQRSLDNFERQFSFVSVSRLVIGPSEATALREYLSRNLYMPVDTLDLGTLFDFSYTPELQQRAAQQRFLLPLGAALRGEEGAQ
jgi:MSHA biogenesis protein MshI